MAALSAGAAQVAPGLVRPEVLAERACSWLVAHGLPLIGAIPGTHSAREGIYVALIDADAELGGTFPRGILHRRKGSISSGKRNRPKPLWRALPAHSSSVLALADFADDAGGNVFPSVDKMAEKTRASRRTEVASPIRTAWRLI